MKGGLFMSSILSKGKDVAEAINIALEILDTTRDEIDVEIIDHGRKKAFGLGNKPAVVKVTKVNKQQKQDSKPVFDETTLFDEYNNG